MEHRKILKKQQNKQKKGKVRKKIKRTECISRSSEFYLTIEKKHILREQENTDNFKN